MSLFEYAQSSFGTGEITPRLAARLDSRIRANGVAKAENFIIEQFGGAYKRPGSRFVAEIKTSANPVRLLAFQFTTLQNYVIEAGVTYMRFFTNDARLESPPGTPVEISTLYQSDDLPNLQTAQSADILYICDGANRPQELSRVSASSFAIGPYTMIDGPYFDENETTTTLTPSAASGTINITASSTAGINGGTGFVATDVGRLVRIKAGGTPQWGYAEITVFTSTTVVTASVKRNFGAAPVATTVWRMGAWSNTTGWPGAFEFHAGRLFAGFTAAEPGKVWGSRPGNPNDQTPSDADSTVTSSHAINVSSGNGNVAAIRWLSSKQQGLVVGTTDNELLLKASASTEALGPGNAELLLQDNRGSAAVKAVNVGTNIVAVQRGGTALREYVYGLENDTYSGGEISLFAEHLFQPGVTRITYQQSPYSIIWAVLGSGILGGLTFDRSQEVAAWHRHTFSGTVEDVVSIFRNPMDQVWIVVLRTINSVTKRYVEAIANRQVDNPDLNDVFYVDSGLTYDGAPTTVITGLGHLEGKTVTILADGASHPTKVVAAGQITLDRTASTVQVGLGYVSTVRTMPYLTLPSAGLATQARLKRPVKAYVYLDQTNNLSMQALTEDGAYDLEEITFRALDDPMDAPVPLFTGIREIGIGAPSTLNASLEFTSVLPLPCHVLGLNMVLEVQ